MINIQDFILQNQLPEERFLPVKNFESRFYISDFGRIVSHDHRKNTVSFLSPAIDSAGYYNTQLRMKPINTRIRVHKLVGLHYCPMIIIPDKRMVWNHKDGNKLNNYYKNIEYVTALYNSQHAVNTGLFDTKGEKHHNSKLSEADVLQMRLLYKTGLTQKVIGEMFGVSRRQAGDVIKGKNWGWLT